MMTPTLRLIPDPRSPTWLALTKPAAQAKAGQWVTAGVVEDDGALLELRLPTDGPPEVRANAWNHYAEPAARANVFAGWLEAATGRRWQVVASEVRSWKITITLRMTKGRAHVRPVVPGPETAVPAPDQAGLSAQGDAFEDP